MPTTIASTSHVSVRSLRAACRRSLALTAVSALLGAPAFAQTNTVVDPGLRRALVEQLAIPHHTFTLENGLKVIVHEDHSDAVVAVYVSYHVGSAREEAGKSGFAHLFEHMLFQGSQHVGDDMHFKYVTEAGGTLNGTTNTDRTVYFETLPSNQLEVALWLEADRMGFLLPALTQETLANQIDVVKNERRQNYENRPYGQDPGALVAALYPADHPYSWLTIGSHEDLAGASLDDVKRFFARWYGPNNATLAIGGDVDPAEVRILVERWFGPIARGPAVDRPAPRPVALDAVERIVREDKVRLPQLTIAWPSAPSGSDDEAALDTLAAILGGNKASILTRALTIDATLAQSVQVGSDTRELAGTFDVTVRAQMGVSLDTLEARVHEVLARVAREGVDPQTLERAKQRYAADFVRRLETVSSRTGILAESNTIDGRPDGYLDRFEARMAVTEADLVRVLRRYVVGRPAVVLSTVPAGKPELATKDTPFPPPIEDEIVAVDRSTKPTQGRTPPFHAPAVWRAKKGANGVELAGVIWNERPLSTVSVSIPAGRTRETARDLGLSSFVASMLQQGTSKLDAVAYARELDALGANLSVAPGDDEITLTLSCLDAQLAEGVKLLTDVITSPRFDEGDFARLAKERATAVETRADQIRSIAGDVYARLVYGAESVLGSPSIGTKETVAGFTLASVRDFWRDFGRPAGARISYVGSLDESKVTRALQPLVESWTGAAPAVAARPAPPVIGATRVYLVDKPGAAQSEIRIGHMGPASTHADFYALSMVNWILGGAFSSRVNLNLREKHGYTYGARTAFEGGPHGGPFTASAGVKTEDTAASIVEFLRELRTIRDGVTSDELAFTKDALGLGARRQYESTASLVGLLDNVTKLGFAPDYPAKRLAELESTTVERLNELARTWIHPDAMVILIVGDKQKVLPQLRASEEFQKLELGEPIELDVHGRPVGG